MAVLAVLSEMGNGISLSIADESRRHASDSAVTIARDVHVLAASFKSNQIIAGGAAGLAARRDLLKSFEESSTTRIAERVHAQLQAQAAARIRSGPQSIMMTATPSAGQGFAAQFMAGAAPSHTAMLHYAASGSTTPEAQFRAAGASIPVPQLPGASAALPQSQRARSASSFEGPSTTHGQPGNARVSFDAVPSPKSSAAPAPVTPHPSKGQLNRGASPSESDAVSPPATQAQDAAATDIDQSTELAVSAALAAAQHALASDGSAGLQPGQPGGLTSGALHTHAEAVNDDDSAFVASPRSAATWRASSMRASQGSNASRPLHVTTRSPALDPADDRVVSFDEDTDQVCNTLHLSRKLAHVAWCT